MERLICLDGVSVSVACDRVEVDIKQGGRHAHVPTGVLAERCVCGEGWQPVLGYADGTVVYFHCAPEGERGPTGYKVIGPRPVRWNLTVIQKGSERIAQLSWERA